MTDISPERSEGAEPAVEPARPPRKPRRRFRPGRREVALVARALVLLALVGVAVATFAQTLLDRTWMVAFIQGNTLPKVDRERLILSELGAAVGVALAALVFWLVRRRKGGLRLVVTLARRAAPVIPLGFVPFLFRLSGWDPLDRAVLITAFVLGLELTAAWAFAEAMRRPGALLGRLGAPLARAGRFVRQAFATERVPIAPILVGLAVVAFASYFGYFTIINHRHFKTMAFDLGIYDNIAYNALHGHPFRATTLIREGDWSYLRGHAEFSIYALLPFYALHPNAETLLVLQAVVLGSGAIPLYRFAARRLPKLLAVLLAFAYLFYAPLHQAAFYDVHFQVFAAALTLWAIDALDARRYIRFGVFFVLALGCREDISIGFAVLGLFLLFSGVRPRAGAILTIACAAFFVIVKFVVMPRFGPWWFQNMYKDLYPDGEATYAGVIKTMISNPLFLIRTLVKSDKLRFLLQVIAPLAFLPLRRGLLWMSILPGAFFTLLTTGYDPTVQISFQYVAYNVPYMFAATALALSEPGRIAGPGGLPKVLDPSARVKRTAAAIALAAGTILTTQAWGAMPPSAGFRGGFYEIDFGPLSAAEKQRRKDLLELAAMVPRDARLAASEHELPHVSARLVCYDLREGYEGAEWMLYAEGSGWFGSDHATKAMRTGEWTEVARRGSLVLIKKIK